MAKKKKKTPDNVLGQNRRARHDFDITETFEAGVELRGSEVKSVRARNFHFSDAYAEFDGHELFIAGMHIAEYTQANQFNHNPSRRRKVLLHRRELDKLKVQIEQKGMTIVPLDLHVSGRWIKARLGLAKGRKEHDKRQAIKARMQKRDVDRALKDY